LPGEDFASRIPWTDARSCSPLIEAAKAGTTIGAPKANAPAPAATSMEEKPQGQPTVVFDYTHLRPKGADYFSNMVAVELARAAADLRKDFVEELYPPYR
jgi:hypothetical protein